MKKTKLGVAVTGGTPSALLAHIKQCLNIGYDALEIHLDDLPLIIHGDVCGRYVDWLRAALSDYPATYTAHVGAGLDLRGKDYDLHRRALFSSVEVCAQLGAVLLNLHYEEQGRDLRAEKRFLDVHREAASRAMDKGVRLSVENIETEHSARAAEFVERVDHPNLYLTIDTGHLHLSSNYFGYDFRQTLGRCAGKLGHIHLNDNAGVFCPLRERDFERYRLLSMKRRFLFGEGDIHLPPGFGSAPFADMLSYFPNFAGIAVCEYNFPSFEPFAREIYDFARGLINPHKE